MGHPRRLPWVTVALLVVTIGLELAQSYVASRHGRAADAAVKIAGIVVAAAVVGLVNELEVRWRAARSAR
jgi:VanZ family protein